MFIALDLGVPPSTVAGWIGTSPPDVFTHEVLEPEVAELQQRRVLRLERRLP